MSDGLLKPVHGLLVRVAARGALGRAGQILDGLGAVVGLRVVVGEAVVRLLETPPVERLERAPGRGVERAAPGLGQARVRDLLDQRVLEDVDGPTGSASLVQELQARELVQVGLQRPFPDRREELLRELAAQERGCLEQTPRLRREAVDPRLQELLDRVRHGPRGLEVPLLGDRAGHLLKEERVALGLVEDQPRLSLGQRRGRQHRAHQLEALLM